MKPNRFAKQSLAAALSFVALLTLAVGAAPVCLAAPNVVETSAKACVLMERETGSILYSEHEHDELEPASVTKVMTMLLTVEALDSGAISMEDTVTASEYASSMGGSQVYLKEGEQMSVRDLLKSVAVASGNDAAVALAEYIAGSETAFVEKMNARAQELGMNNTHFANCNGLPAEGHYSSAYDIALMSRALLGHDTIREFVSIWMDTIRDGTFQLSNTNKLIYYYDGATGLKTGSTDAAGCCISASALREGMELIAVVLGSKTSALRFSTAKNLLNYGFGGFALVDVSPEALPPVPVLLGKADEVAVTMDGKEACRLVTERAKKDSITTRCELAEEVSAPVAAGDRLGTLSIAVDGKLVKQMPLIAAESVEKLGFYGVFERFFQRMAMQE